MIDITWDSPDARSGGSSRKASTVHGWVTKLRGTLIDDENVRRRGIHEMREARAVREHNQAKKEKGLPVKEGGNLMLSFLPAKKPPQPNNQLMVVRRHTTTGSRKPSTHSAQSSRQSHDSRPRPSQRPRSAPNSKLTRTATQTRATSPPGDHWQLIRSTTQHNMDAAGVRRPPQVRQASMPMPSGHHQRHHHRHHSRHPSSSSRVQSPPGRPAKRYTQ